MRRGWAGLGVFALVLGSSAFAGCTSSSDREPDAASDVVDAGVTGPADGAAEEECTVSAPTSCPDPPVVFGDVEPIIAERCVVCHLGARGGPWALTSYRHVRDWSEQIRGVVLNCVMPPPDAGIPITTDER